MEKRNKKIWWPIKPLGALWFELGAPKTYVGGSGVGITSDTSPPSVYSATEDFFGCFLGLSCNNCYFLSWAHSIARAAGPRAHLCREPGSVGPSAGPRRGWRCLAAGTGTRKEPAPGQCWRKASKDLGEVWEAWLQERWRGTGGGASELGPAPHGAGCCRCTGWGEAGRKGGYGSSWGGWGMSLNVPWALLPSLGLVFWKVAWLCSASWWIPTELPLRISVLCSWLVEAKSERGLCSAFHAALEQSAPVEVGQSVIPRPFRLFSCYACVSCLASRGAQDQFDG